MPRESGRACIHSRTLRRVLRALGALAVVYRARQTSPNTGRPRDRRSGIAPRHRGRRRVVARHELANSRQRASDSRQGIRRQSLRVRGRDCRPSTIVRPLAGRVLGLAEGGLVRAPVTGTEGAQAPCDSPKSAREGRDAGQCSDRCTAFRPRRRRRRNTTAPKRLRRGRIMGPTCSRHVNSRWERPGPGRKVLGARQRAGAAGLGCPARVARWVRPADARGVGLHHRREAPEG